MPKNMNSAPRNDGEERSQEVTGWEDMDVRAENELAEQDEEPAEVPLEETSEIEDEEATEMVPTNFPLGHLMNGNNISESSSADKPDGEGEFEAETSMFEQLNSEDSEKNPAELDNSMAAASMETEFISDKQNQEHESPEVFSEQDDQTYEIAEEQSEDDQKGKEAEEDPEKS